MAKFKTYYFNEAVAILDVKKEKGKTKVQIITGRFQPVTSGHTKVVEQMKSKFKEPIMIVLIKGEKLRLDKEKNPLDEDTQIKLIKKSLGSKIKDVMVTTDGFIGTIVDSLRRKNMEPVAFWLGTDRLENYKNQVNKFGKDLDLDLKLEEVKRTEDDISATKVRDSIKNDDFSVFSKLTDNLDNEDFELLKKKI